ncbi:hypothetical protein ACROYT_G039400 [Oculina patagonica]
MAARVISREPKDPQELYKEALENVSAFNSRLRYERRLRIPFIDAQTGIAMNNCHLWISKLERQPGQTPHYIYSYPARRWRKKKRPPPAERSSEVKASETEEQVSESMDTMESEGVLPEESEADHTREVSAVKEEEMRMIDSDGEEEVQDDIGALSSDDEEFYVGKKKPISKGRPRKKTHHVTSVFPEPPVHHKTISQIPGLLHVRNITKEELARMDPEERKKPYACEICGRRYKNGPGLKYHYTHYNHEQESGATHHEEPVISHPSTPATNAPAESPKVPPSPPQQRGPGRPKKLPGASPNNYCDFCLGDVFENKSTGFPEELLSCADCGRSGHPSCLQFTGKLTESVKKYKWQCIECKSCTLCGTSDNDDQLLFCDGCDRGYHMYCLKPPMQKPPEGHWTCQLCENPVTSAPAPPPHMMMKAEWH